MPVSFPLPRQPFGWVKVGTERSRNELSFGWPISEKRPWRRKERPPIPCLLHCSHLERDLVWRKQVVSVEPLNIIAATQRRCCVPGGCSSLIRLRYHSNTFGLESARNCQSPVSRTVVDDNDLFIGPGLCDGRFQCSGNPILGARYAGIKMETNVLMKLLSPAMCLLRSTAPPAVVSSVPEHETVARLLHSWGSGEFSAALWPSFPLVVVFLLPITFVFFQCFWSLFAATAVVFDVAVDVGE